MSKTPTYNELSKRVRELEDIKRDTNKKLEKSYSEFSALSKRESQVNKVLTNLSLGGSLDEVLSMILNVAEEESPGTIASILFVDKDGKRLLTDVKTRLPKYFIAAIDGTPVKDGMGSCGTAAFRGETIIVENIQTHPYWKGVREITRKAGLGSCWSQPVIASNGNVVGTFALYSNKPKKPSQDELKLMGRMAQLAAISLESHHIKKEKLILSKMLENIIDSMPSVLIGVDPDGNVTQWNRKAQQETGITFLKAVGKKLEQVFPRMSSEMKRIYEAIKKQEMYSKSRQALKNDGKTRYENVTVYPLISNGIEGAVIRLDDVTERKQAEKALRESEEKFRSLTNNLNVGIYRNTTGPEGKFIEVNPAIVDMFGFDSKNEFMKIKVSELYKNSHKRNDFNNKLIREGKIKNEELELLRKDGSTFIASVSSVAVKDDAGIIKYFDGNIEDITIRKQAETALIESEEKYRTVLEANPDPVVVYDMKGRVIYFNATFAHVFGWSLEECLGEKMDHFVPKEALPETKMMIGRVSEGKRFSNVRTQRYNKKGKIIPVSVTGTSYKDDKGNLIGSIINLRDISSQKEMESQLQQSQKMEAIGTLAGGIAHDFNNILSGIFGYSQLAEMHIDEPERAKSDIRNIVKGASRATELVQQILTFSRKTDYEKQYLDLFFIVKEVLKLIRSTIPTTIEIKERIHSKASIYADPIQMHQVIMNLCTNAYHAMSDSGGDLIVRLDETYMPHLNNESMKNVKQKYLELEISDTGHGMDENTMEKIFDPYFTTKTMGKGTGLGLALVRAIVEEHGGKIKVNSTVSSGSTFLLYLPIAEKKEKTNEENSFEKKISTGTESILFVDDEKGIRSFVQDFLSNYGYTVTVSDNGQKAYERFKQAPKSFDIVITDMAMPKMSGDELALKIIAMRKDIPIILCTGYTEKFNKEKAEEIGITRYIDKPIAGKALCLLIREVLDEKND